MMPNVHGPDRTRVEIFGYTVATAVTAFLPVAFGCAGLGYAAAAAILGAGFILCAWRVLGTRTGFAADRSARHLFTFSILYLFALFGALWVEHGFGVVQ